MYKRRVYRHEVVQPLDQSYRLIPLTQGQSALVDTTDYEFLMQWNWSALWEPDSQTFYAIRGARPQIRMHRGIVRCDITREIDHINHNGLDNRRENLRVCSHAQNKRNSRKQRDNTSGYKGVSFYKKNSRWMAYITFNGNRIHLGYFSTDIEAARAYDTAALKHFGLFAYLNLPI